MGPLHLPAPIMCQKQVQVLADAPEGLLEPLGLRPQQVPVIPADGFQQPAVEGVAVAGDLGNQRREPGVGVVTCLYKGQAGAKGLWPVMAAMSEPQMPLTWGWTKCQPSLGSVGGSTSSR